MLVDPALEVGSCVLADRRVAPSIGQNSNATIGFLCRISFAFVGAFLGAGGPTAAEAALAATPSVLEAAILAMRGAYADNLAYVSYKPLHFAVWA